MLKIYNFARGPHGLRVLWQCEEMGLRYEIVKVPFPADDAYLVRNPLGSVPFLEDEGGVAINESIAMMLYIAHKYGPPPLLPASDDPTLARALQMTIYGEATIGMGLNPIMEARFVAPEADKRNWTVQAQEARVAKAVRYAAEILGTNPYLAGPQFTLADISMSPGLQMWRGPCGQPLPENLIAYLDRLAARPAYQRALAAREAS